ncbi:hypothetical protein BD309DRAFT_945429 [Dichomitus squalens]|uniref:Uncharacterized protein n=1 Tax=Dichomitus squalens TaxID=114155 RepID=A0A4Q9Q7E2_9APHY|nr:hypothetical protein BD309DRAFT_945429 [Dichomitus squalens]TBU62906.1 hypothetical protein BD310DRAFT_917390 [Dichomitus squalens]
MFNSRVKKRPRCNDVAACLCGLGACSHAIVIEPLTHPAGADLTEGRRGEVSLADVVAALLSYGVDLL